jgi:hypothetical protein
MLRTFWLSRGVAVAVRKPLVAVALAVIVLLFRVSPLVGVLVLKADYLCRQVLTRSRLVLVGQALQPPQVEQTVLILYFIPLLLWAEEAGALSGSAPRVQEARGVVQGYSET